MGGRGVPLASCRCRLAVACCLEAGDVVSASFVLNVTDAHHLFSNNKLGRQPWLAMNPTACEHDCEPWPLPSDSHQRIDSRRKQVTAAEHWQDASGTQTATVFASATPPQLVNRVVSPTGDRAVQFPAAELIAVLS